MEILLETSKVDVNTRGPTRIPIVHPERVTTPEFEKARVEEVPSKEKHKTPGWKGNPIPSKAEPHCLLGVENPLNQRKILNHHFFFPRAELTWRGENPDTRRDNDFLQFLKERGKPEGNLSRAIHSDKEEWPIQGTATPLRQRDQKSARPRVERRSLRPTLSPSRAGRNRQATSPWF